MTDESYSFSTARARLEDIVSQVRKKDTSLEKSLDLLEEGVRLANACTELIDHQDWAAANAPTVATVPGAEQGSASGADAAAAPEVGSGEDGAPDSAGDDSETIVVDGVAVIEDVVITDDDGEFVAEVIEVTEYIPETDFADADDAWADDSESMPAETPDEPSVDEG
jgi:exodeoxyribonuclease VII small subunit